MSLFPEGAAAVNAMIGYPQSTSSLIKRPREQGARGGVPFLVEVAGLRDCNSGMACRSRNILFEEALSYI